MERRMDDTLSLAKVVSIFVPPAFPAGSRNNAKPRFSFVCVVLIECGVSYVPTKQHVVKINNVSRVTFYTAYLVIILIGGPDACGFNELSCRTTSRQLTLRALSLDEIPIFNQDHLQGSLTLPRNLFPFPQFYPRV